MCNSAPRDRPVGPDNYMRVKHVFFALTIAVTQSCAMGSNQLTSPERTSETMKFDGLAAEFTKDHASLEIPGHELSFVANLENLKSRDALKRQQAVFQAYNARLSFIEPSHLGLCDKIDYGIMSSMVQLGARRAELALRYIEMSAPTEKPRSLHDVPLGREWYHYYLAFWNGADLDPDAVFAFGEAALKNSVADYDALQKKMGFAGNDNGFADYLQEKTLRLDGGAPTQELFRAKQSRVWTNFARLFPDTYGVSMAAITQSDRGANFAVPGYYDLETRTFFYNLFKPTFDARQADWLFLHEATPGHHFQLTARRRCSGKFPGQSFPAYSEGWAAYTETLGEDLGLYHKPEEKLAAVEWDMVRSVRVVLDVALNAYGWSDEQALDYWRQNVRGQRDIAQREIDRMRRWPAQVITYKYGANVFHRIRQEFVSDSNEEDDVRAFHQAAIAYGSMPLSVFENLFPVLVEDEEAELKK